ncbi:hypothetical protein SFUMM280S_01947 [Streptomyces fumanus]
MSLYGATSCTKRAPTRSSGGRSLQKSSSMTHWVNGSVITGQRSPTWKSSSTSSRSPGEVAGVMRSTMLPGKETRSWIHRASAGSRRPARVAVAARAAAALSGRLSQDSTVNGAWWARRRRSRASTITPNTESAPAQGPSGRT